MNANNSYELNKLEDGTALRVLIKNLFLCSPDTCEKIGQGFYAQVYKVSLSKPPYAVIVKCHQYANRAHAESQQLQLLQQHALTKIPQVYALQTKSDWFPCDAIIMEYISGINASHIQFPNQHIQTEFVNEVIENLYAWHSVHNPNGFGDLDHPLEKSWKAAYGKKIAMWHNMIHAMGHNSPISQPVMNIVDKSYALFDRVFEKASQQSSLVHSDYNVWNMLVDPETYRLQGVIDPIDAGWADPEIDLFHLANGRPDLGLLDCYLEQLEIDDSFWMRFYFYRFWDDIKHFLRMGWYEEEHFKQYANLLDEQIRECL